MYNPNSNISISQSCGCIKCKSKALKSAGNPFLMRKWNDEKKDDDGNKNNMTAADIVFTTNSMSVKAKNMLRDHRVSI
jgi:hypothetical protein